MTTNDRTTLSPQHRRQKELVIIRPMYIHMAVVTWDTGPRGFMLIVIVVLWNTVTLRTERKVRRLIGLLRHPRKVRTMRLVAVQTATFLCGIVNRSLVIIWERTLELVVALPAHLSNPPE